MKRGSQRYKIPAAEDRLLNLDVTREGLGPPISAHSLPPSLSHLVGDHGQPKTAKGEKQERKLKANS